MRMNLKLLFTLVVAPFVLVKSTNCNFNGVDYTCMNKNKCKNSVVTGLCPGDSSNICCVKLANPKNTIATEVYNFFKAKGWTKNAICGLLGNMEFESNLNPNRKQSGGNGYGLVQWSPASVTAKTQCLRIQYEFGLQNTNSNEKQYYKTKQCNLTFSQFSKSTSSPEYLAECFMRNYERPNEKKAQLPKRKEYAKKWFKHFK
ncbi:hypothetical protein PIROE2DRAFT_18884 [Piromyces sp. E2]|nr:hypothetical protein PIROE2DRAFT_18884 [Piromyces sp. E2]|eukprot:OUM56495.1 hypothetical protein PIROE2DRAFT_18884 [Piromyces sp. E2]